MTASAECDSNGGSLTRAPAIKEIRTHQHNVGITSSEAAVVVEVAGGS